MANDKLISALASTLSTLFQVEEHTLAIFSSLKSIQGSKFCNAMEEQSELLKQFTEDIAAEVNAHSYNEQCTEEECFRLSLSSIRRLLEQIHYRRYEVTERQAENLNQNCEGIAGCLMLKLAQNFYQAHKRIRLVNDEITLIAALQLSYSDRATLIQELPRSLKKHSTATRKIIQAYSKLMKKQYEHLSKLKGDAEAAKMIKNLQGKLDNSMTEPKAALAM